MHFFNELNIKDFKATLINFFTNLRKSTKDVPTPKETSMFFSFITIAFVTVGYFLQKKFNLIGVFYSEVIVLLFPLILFLKFKNYSFKTVLKLNKVKPSLIFLSMGILVFSWPFVTVINLIYAFIIRLIFGNFTNSVPHLYNGFIGTFLSLLIISITPAIIEELVFRGMVSSSFETYGKKWSIILSGVLFSLLHCDFQKLPGIIILGMILAWLAYRSKSIYCSMSAHFANNFLATLLLIAGNAISEYAKSINSSNINEIHPEMADGLIAGYVIAAYIILMIYSFIGALLYLLVKSFLKQTAILVPTLEQRKIKIRQDGLIWLLPGIITIVFIYILQGIKMLNIPIKFFN